MKKIPFSLCLLAIAVASQAQKQNNNWVFGFNAALDFNSIPPTPFRVAMSGLGTSFNQAGVAVSDRHTGQMFFYTDGVSVWNRNLNIMPNGQNAKTYIGTNFNCAAIVPVLDNPNRYYIFTVSPPNTTPIAGWGAYAGRSYTGGVLSYSIVDMTLDNGRGDVLPGQKDIILDSSGLAGKIATAPGTGCNIWLLVRAKNSNDFRTYEITPAGISTAPVTSAAGPVISANSAFQAIGSMKLSRDFKKLLVTFGQNYTPGAAVYDFNRATGTVSSPIVLNFDLGTYPICGAAFSPDGTKAYCSEVCNMGNSCSGTTRIFQFDLSLGSQAAIQTSRVQVAAVNNAGSGFGSRGGDMELGLDDKVYVSAQSSGVAYITTGLGGRLYTIDQPNVYGPGCLFQSTPVPIMPHVDSAGYGFPVPVVFPTPDTMTTTTDFCYSSDSIVLQAPPGFFTSQWNTGSADTTLVIRSTGTFWVRSENYCTIRTDTFHVVPSPVTVDLGPDLSLCRSDTAVLRSSVAYTSPQYQWNTGAVTPSIEVTQSGAYILKVSENGCSGSDTIQVTVYSSFPVDLGPDTGICDRDVPLVLTSPQPAGVSYLWSNGLSDTAMSVFRSGTYWLEVSMGDCIGSDTIRIKIIPAPEVSIGSDTAICKQTSLRTGMEIPGAAYRWNTGETTPFISVSSTGIYMLEINLEGCVVHDTIAVTVMADPEIDLGPDGDICPEQTIVLDGTYGANSSYVWNTGETTPAISVSSPGTYGVRVRTEYGCTGGDTVVLIRYPKPAVYLGADTVVCEETPLVLRPDQVNANSLLWSDGSIGNTLTIRNGGQYIVTGINKCGTGADTVEVKQIFCDIWVPNAFTPNGDGGNDVFRVLGNTGRLEEFGLSIYNRWGQRIFYTRDKRRGWDGTLKGAPALLGTYAYLLEYSLNGKPYVQKGNFHLLR